MFAPFNDEPLPQEPRPLSLPLSHVPCGYRNAAISSGDPCQQRRSTGTCLRCRSLHRSSLEQCIHQRGHHQKRESKRRQELPIETKHVIDADAQQRILDPHDDPVADESFEYDHGNRQERTDLLEAKESVATEEQNGPEAAECKGMQKFTGIEHAELHARIFDVVTGDQFRFAFCHIERSASEFGDGGDEEDQRGKRSQEYKPDILLALDDRAHAHRAREYRRDQQHGQHRDFKRDHHRHLTECADQRKLVIR